MTSSDPNPEDHARAVRIAARRDLYDDLLRAAGVTVPAAETTQPIPVIAHAELPRSWLTAD